MTRALLAAWLALPLVAAAASAQQPIGIADPCIDYATGALRAGCRVVVRQTSPCDFAELLAASRAWAKLLDEQRNESTWHRLNLPARLGDVVSGELRAQYLRRESAEQRWRKAVEACGP